MNQELWHKCREFHGHECPGLAIGYRAAEIACRELGMELGRTEDEDIVCVTENDACGVDAIQCLLSCTVGKGNLILRPRGKSAYSFFDRKTGKSVRLVLIEPDRDAYTRQELMEHILNDDPSGIFKVGAPGFTVPEKARMFGSRVCECCGETAREDMVRFQDGKVVCLDCFRGYSRGWM